MLLALYLLPFGETQTLLIPRFELDGLMNDADLLFYGDGGSISIGVPSDLK